MVQKRHPTQSVSTNMNPNSQENANCSLEVNNPIALTSNPTTEAAKHMDENFFATP